MPAAINPNLLIDHHLLHGHVAPGFEGVAQAFADNFTQRNEQGAACAVWWQGQLAVDLWGGYADHRSRQPWAHNTLVSMFSVVKGVSALALAHAASRGLFDYDEPVALRWPQFAVQGKAGITVAQLLSHRAGLPVLDSGISAATLDRGNRAALDLLLARQTPVVAPGTVAYHIISWGLFVNAWFRRADPQGRTIGEYFADELATPLGLDFHFRVSNEALAQRLAHMVEINWRNALPKVPQLYPNMGKALAQPWSLMVRAVLNLRGFSINDRHWLGNELPSAIGFGTAGSLARLYGALATGGQQLGISPAVFQRLCGGYGGQGNGLQFDQVMRLPLHYNLGLMKPGGGFVFGSDARAFGMPGLGGSFAFADPTTGLGYCYGTSRINAYPANDPRENSLRQAVFQAINQVHQPTVSEIQKSLGPRGLV